MPSRKIIVGDWVEILKKIGTFTKGDIAKVTCIYEDHYDVKDAFCGNNDVQRVPKEFVKKEV